MKHYKTFQYKLKPTKEQEQKLEQWVGTCRYIYNLCLEYKITLWKHYRISISEYDMVSELTRLSKDFDWICEVNAQSRGMVVRRLFSAYKTFFKKGGFPKFAKKGVFSSIEFRQVDNGLRIDPDTSIIRLPKFGKVRFYNSQPCGDKIKTATVKNLLDGWYVFVVAEIEIDHLPVVESKIGIDVGIKSIITTSKGEMISNPRHLRKFERKLKRLQRSVSRKKKGGSNRKKAIKKLAFQHQKLANIRKDFQHKLTTRLIRENQAIVVEDLQVENLLKNHHFAKAIADASWHRLVEMLTYKSLWYGRIFIKVPAPYTSKTCSNCGYINQKLTLNMRRWACPSCGSDLDRDINAAINIKNKGIAL